MGPELSLLIGSIVGGTGALLSYWAGWRARGRVIVISRRGSNPPPPGRKPAPPQGPPSRRRNPFVSELQQQINDAIGIDGYRSINYPDPSPDRRPTNPFNGEQIPNPPPREP